MDYRKSFATEAAGYDWAAYGSTYTPMAAPASSQRKKNIRRGKSNKVDMSIVDPLQTH
jgi:hypothetical protein